MSLSSHWYVAIAQLVEQMSHDPKFKGLYPMAAETKRKYWSKSFIFHNT